jgi:hypothetical protein
MFVHVMLDGLQHEYERQRAMDQQIAVAFDVSSVAWVEVYKMSVEGKSGEAEKKGAIRGEGM